MAVVGQSQSRRKKPTLQPVVIATLVGREQAPRSSGSFAMPELRGACSRPTGHGAGRNALDRPWGTTILRCQNTGCREFLSDRKVKDSRRIPAASNQPRLTDGFGQFDESFIQMPKLLSLILVFAVCAQARADGDWVDYRTTGPFVCRSEFRLTNSEPLLTELGELPKHINKTLGLKTSDEKIEVNLFRDRRSFVQFVSRRFPEGARRQALYIKGPDMGRMYVYRHSKLDSDVRHEATHAILHNALPFLPLWLDEGLAEYFEVASSRRTAGDRQLAGLRWRMRFGWTPELSKLEAKRKLSDMKTGDYREAWAWVHFMLHGSPEAREVLLKYLNDIESSDPPGQLSEALLRRVPNAERKLVAHLKSSSQR